MNVEQKSFGTLSVFEINTETISSLQNGSNNELDYKQIGPEDAEQIQEVMEATGMYEPSTVNNRLAQGRWGYAGYLGKIPVTFGWVALDATSVGSTGLDFVPPHGDAYLFDFATVPDYRGRGYYPLLLRYILVDLAERKVKRAWIATAPGNEKSARSIARAGFLKIADTNIIPAGTNRTAQIELIKVPGVSAALVEMGKTAHVPNNLYKF